MSWAGILTAIGSDTCHASRQRSPRWAAHAQRFFRCFFLVTSLTIANGGATESVYRALDRQDEWLARSSNGSGWHSYLRTDELRDGLAAPSMDRRVLARVLGRYNSHAPGLSAGPFRATKHALTRLANELNVPLTLRWAEQLRASTAFTPGVDTNAVLNAKQELISAKNQLATYLAQTDSATREGWKSFLKWDEFESALREVSPDWKQLEAVTVQFYNGYPGLEFPEFVRVREALRRYSYLGKAAEAGGSTKSINQYLDALSQALEKYNAEPTTKHASDAAVLADWLEGIGHDQGGCQ